MKSVLAGVTDKTVRCLLRDAMRAGCEVTWTGSNHIRVMTPEGPVFVAGTPSSQRSVHHVRTMLKRKGVNLP